MPTNNKTSLGLNSWLGTDKPKRSDFVEDNTLLNTLLTAHFNDTFGHLSAADRLLLEQGVAVGTYLGDGQASQDITLPFEAKVVIVLLPHKPAILYKTSGEYTENDFAVATAMGATLGLTLDQSKLTVCQTLTVPAAGGILNNLNSASKEYVYIAFR
jgi:hypothetical protein